MDKPLDGLLVVEFAQFMAGPTAGLRLADLGAKVIKIERPVTGEMGRQIAIKNIFVDSSSLVFHTINRNKESYAANLKDQEDLKAVKALVQKADVLIHNFRPGVMEKFGLDYENSRKLNQRLIYAVVTGYGNKGPWANKPGQDLLVQSLSGITWLSGRGDQGPVPFGLAVIDMYCATHLTQGILAGLLKRHKTREGCLVEVSLLESALDMQFEVLTTHLNDNHTLPNRSKVKGAGHAYLSAPYGVYQTKDSYLALAMGDLKKIAQLLQLTGEDFENPDSWFSKRDELLIQIGSRLAEKETQEIIDFLHEHGVWSSEVNDYHKFFKSEGFKSAQALQEVTLQDGRKITTTRSPYHIDGERFISAKAAPQVGEHSLSFNDEHLINF